MSMTAAVTSQDEGIKPFIQKLHTMVSDPATSSYFTWTKDGSAVTIINVERFVSELLPLYFKHSNLSSFVRQLNTYGFSKVDSSGEGSYVYSHPEFRRDFPERLALIQRKSSHRGALGAVGGDGYGDDALSAHVLHPVVGDASAPPPIKTTDLGHAHELQSIFSTIRRMEGRIGELQEQVKATKMQQVDTRQCMGKLMDFLSHVYNEHKVTSVSSAAAAPPQIHVSEAAVRQAEKRRRLDGGGARGSPGSAPAVELVGDGPLPEGVTTLHQRNAPNAGSGAIQLAVPDSVTLAPNPVMRGPSLLPNASSASESSGDLRLAAPKPISPCVTDFSMGSSNHSRLTVPPYVGNGAAPSSSNPASVHSTLMPQQEALARSTSLGAHVALALPSDLRGFAFDELTSSTELQEATIDQVKEKAKNTNGAGIHTAGAEDFLWDFLEASQDIAGGLGGGAEMPKL